MNKKYVTQKESKVYYFFDSIISPNIKSTVYCSAIKHGGDEEWNFAWDRLQASNVATEKDKLLSALGCSNNTATLTK